MTDSLVAPRLSSTNWHSGAGVVDSVFSTADDVAKGDWLGVGLNGVAAGLDTLGVFVDPFGSLAAAGFGWVEEHVPPLPQMLNSLAGDPDSIVAFAKTWSNVADRLKQVADSLAATVASDTANWHGTSIDAYRSFSAAEVEFIRGASGAADALSVIVTVAGTIVATVRAIVRDLIAEFCAKVLEYLIEEAASMGFATPLVIAQISITAAEWAAKAMKWFERLASAVAKLIRKADEALPAVKGLTDLLRKMAAVKPHTLGYFEPAPGSAFPKLVPLATLRHTTIRDTFKNSDTANDNLGPGS